MALSNAAVLTNLADNAKTAIFNATTNTQLWLNVADYLYKEFTADAPLDEKEELPRYNRAVQAYKAMGYTSIPKEWELDIRGDKKYTKFACNFKDVQDKLKSELENFNDCSYDMKLQIGGIVSSIHHFFVSILARKINPYRKNGIECMLLTELAMWLIIDLPRYKVTQKETAGFVTKRIAYCKAIRNGAFINLDTGTAASIVNTIENDDNIVDPQKLIDSITVELEQLEKHFIHAHQGAHFSEKIEIINNKIKDLNCYTFNILYLMLEKGNTHDFQVKEFLGFDGGRQLQTARLRPYLLSQWIEATLKAAKITGNNFTSSEIISFESIGSHINYTIPDLETIRKHGTDTFARSLGFHDFVWKTDDSATASWSSTQADKYFSGTATVDLGEIRFDKVNPQEFLNNIINLHRSILRMSYLSKILKKGMEVAKKWGEIWLFSNDAKPMFDGLLAVLNDVVLGHQKALNKFLGSYYTKTFEPFYKKHLWNGNNSEIFAKVEFIIKRFIERSNVTIKSITDAIVDINKKPDNIDAKSTSEDLHFLTQCIYNYLSKCNAENYTKEQLAGLKVLMDSTKSSPIPIIVNQDNPHAVSLIPKTNDQVLEQVAYKSAVEYSLLQLDKNPDSRIRSVLVELINASYGLNIAGPDASDAEVTRLTEGRVKALTELNEYLASVKTKEHSASIKPNKHQKSRGASSVAAPTSIVFARDKAKVPLDIYDLYNPNNEKPESIPEFSKISDLFHQVETLKKSELHKLIYVKLLLAYSDKAESNWLSTSYWNLSYWNSFESLQKHYKKLITALRWIGGQPSLYESENASLMEVINGYLITALDKMCHDCRSWIEIDSTLALQVKISKISVMIDKDKDTIEIMSPMMMESRKRIEESAKAAQQLLSQNKKPIVSYQAGVKPGQPKFEQQPAAFRPSLVATSNTDKSKVKSNKVKAVG